MDKIKQTIIIRQDLKLPKGKTAAQAAHASVEAVLKSNKDLIKRWRMSGMPKIVVKIENEKELYKLNQQAKDLGLITSVITDAGRTVVEPGTTTCMAIGPDFEEKINSLTKNLKLL